MIRNNIQFFGLVKLKFKIHPLQPDTISRRLTKVIPGHSRNSKAAICNIDGCMGRESGNGYGAGVQQQWRETSYSQTGYTFVARLLGYLLHIFSLYFNFSLLQIGICIWFQLWWVSDGTGGRYSGLALIRNDPFHRFESSNTSRVIKIMRCFTWIPLESHLNPTWIGSASLFILSHIRHALSHAGFLSDVQIILVKVMKIIIIFFASIAH